MVRCYDFRSDWCIRTLAGDVAFLASVRRFPKTCEAVLVLCTPLGSVVWRLFLLLSCVLAYSDGTGGVERCLEEYSPSGGCFS
jgi:hypothetical protein